MFRLSKKIFIGLFTGLVNESNHTKWVSSSNQRCTIQPTLYLIYILMNTVKNFTTIPLWLN